MDTRRLILLFVFLFSIYLLFVEWERYTNPPATAAIGQTLPGQTPGASSAAPPVTRDLSVASAIDGGSATPQPAASPSLSAGSASNAQVIRVSTDKLIADISAQGGDIVRLELLEHRANAGSKDNFLLIDPKHRYVAQSGLIGKDLPTRRTIYRVASDARELGDKDSLSVVLETVLADGSLARKQYDFSRGTHLIQVKHTLENRGAEPITGHAYFQLQRDGETPSGESSMTMTFTGPAVFTEKDKFQKISFGDIEDNSAKFAAQANDGWLALVQHYFVAAWLPQGDTPREFFMRKIDANLYASGVILPLAEIAPGASAEIALPLYTGPQEQSALDKLAPGLDLVVDYGWLTVVAVPIFWLLEAIHNFVGNWGWAIILLTILIKLVFFPLSAASYKSMARMRVMTPRMAQIKERYADDRQKMNTEMMELYRKEKINPLGGCLPILIQIPVFIALYWVLLGAVEMRGAPWALWIHDLSIPDPYYVLPLIMVVSMIIQMKLNPTPPDPIQAKIMMAMPFVFGVMFFFFPAGLVLYWVVNNILSIAQQWQITRTIEAGKPATAKS